MSGANYGVLSAPLGGWKVGQMSRGPDWSFRGVKEKNWSNLA